MQTIIRRATTEDLRPLTLLCASTFYETYAERNTDSDMLHYTRTHFAEDSLEREMSTPEITILVSELEDLINGYTAVKQHPKDKTTELLRLYVLKKFHGTGIGRTLLDEAVLFCKRESSEKLFLYVWKENDQAITFYKKYGFSIAGETIFDWGTGKQDEDWIMELKLK